MTSTMPHPNTPELERAAAKVAELRIKYAVSTMKCEESEEKRDKAMKEMEEANKIKEAAELLMEVYEQRMKEKEEWKQHAGDRA